jgi:peptidoglycan/LPS O-acetylase OafA/YrhL
VFVYHSSLFVPHISQTAATLTYTGAFGMCLFFVLSAYLITELLLREKQQTGHSSYASFLYAPNSAHLAALFRFHCFLCRAR